MQLRLLSQRHHPDLFMGKSGLSVANYGCYSVCLAIIAGKTVPEVIELFNEKGVYTAKGLIQSWRAMVELGFSEYFKTNEDPKHLCIAEVDFKPDPKKQQHFVVWLGDGIIIDPWGGVKMKNPYKIYSWRVYKPLKNIVMSKEKNVYGIKELRDPIRKITGKDHGKLDSEKLQKEAGKELEQFIKKAYQVSKDLLISQGELGIAQRENEQLKKDISQTNPITPAQLQDLKDYYRLSGALKTVSEFSK